MARVLFSALPAYGHVVQQVSIALELVARGHEVAWALDPSMHDRVAPADAPRFATESIPLPITDRKRRRSARSSAIRDFFASYVPGLATSMLPGIERAIEVFKPDLVVTELGCYAAATAARKHDLPWAVVSSTVALYNEIYTQIGLVSSWVQRGVAEAQRDSGVEPLPWPLRSPWANIVTGPAGVGGPDPKIQPEDHLVGAVLAHHPGDLSDEMQIFLEGRHPRFAVSFGTQVPEFDADWLERTIRELADLGGAVLVSSPQHFDNLPDNVYLRSWFPVPMAALMPHIDVFVTHAGLNSVSEALWHATPMLMRPLAYDQHAIAAALERMGVGIRLTPSTSVTLAAHEVLGETYRKRAADEREAIRSLGGAKRATDVLLELIERT